MADWYMAQDSVLGAMLIDQRITGEVIASLRAEDFDEGPRREMFTAFRDLFLAGETVDPVTVLHRMGREDKAMRTYAAQLMELTPTANNFREYAAIVREEAKRGKLRALGAALAEGPDLEAAAGLVEEAADLLAGRKRVRSSSMVEAILDFYGRMEQKPDYLSWGLGFLDEGLYAHRGSFVVLGGRPSDGKTAFALFTAYHQAKTMRVGFFSLETDRETLFDRLFGSISRVSSKHIKRRELTEDDYAALAGKSREMEGRDLHLIEAQGMTVQDIQAYALAARFDVIYIDYLQLIRTERKGSRYDAVTQISMDLHTLAGKHKITVVALSQLSRPGKEREKKRLPPVLADLRESGQIEQDADSVLFLYRDEPEALRSPRTLAIAKNKEGETGRVPLKFDGDTQTFREDYNRMIPPARSRAWEEAPVQVTFEELPDDTETPFEEKGD